MSGPPSSDTLYPRFWSILSVTVAPGSLYVSPTLIVAGLLPRIVITGASVSSVLPPETLSVALPPSLAAEVVWPESRESSCAFVIRVSAPLASLTQSLWVRRGLEKKPPLPLAAPESHILILKKRLSKKLVAKDSDAGVELAVVEAISSRRRFKS